MTPVPPGRALDLLIVGALTIDRFADGRAAPGGSVLHSTRAAARAGVTVGVVAVAGQEVEAIDGLDEIQRSAAVLHRVPARRTVTFRHDESGPIRRLFLEVASEPVVAPSDGVEPRAVLYAPVAGELGPDLGGSVHDGAFSAAILQGWLRTLTPGTEVRPLSVATLDPTLAGRLARIDVLVASREDLIADGDTVPAQRDALRRVLGPRPALVVTESVDGAWIDAGGDRRHVEVFERIDGVPTVGAGDAYAAILAAELGSGDTLDVAAADAAEAVSRMLAARRDAL